MAVADRHRHAVERRIVAARDLLPRAKNPGAAVDVVDEADEVEAALAGEIAHHLSELARAVDQDLLHFVSTNCRYLKQSADSGRMRRRYASTVAAASKDCWCMTAPSPRNHSKLMSQERNP